MKFGKRLAASVNPEWRSQFIDYRNLKKALKRVKLNIPVRQEEYDYDISEDRGVFLNIIIENPDLQQSRQGRLFIERCQTELDKINKFFTQQEKKVTERHKQIKFQTEELHKSKVITKQKYELLQNAFKEHYWSLILLNNYKDLNYEGFSKILKKFDKNANMTIKDEMLQKLQNEHFYKSPVLATLITQTEYYAAQELYQGDRKAAMTNLRLPQTDVASSNIQFYCGLFLGGSIMWTLLCIFYYALHYSQLNPRPNDVREMFMYRLILFPILMVLLISLNMKIWERVGINYVFIFELQRNSITAWHFALAPLVLFNLWGCSFFMFMWTVYNDSTKVISFPIWWIHPVILYGIVLAWLFLPLKILGGQARYWLLSCLFRIALAPFYPVTFPDFWIADQLNSLADFLQMTQFVFCMYMPTINDASFCTNTLTLSLPILNIFPFYVRTMQCFRRLRDTKKVHPHLTNAGKYLSNLLASVLAFIDTRIISPNQPGWNHVRTAWLVCNSFSTIYKLYWDLYMDWSLFQGVRKPFAKAPLLRKEILYHPIFYYLAAIFNTIVRLMWVIYFVTRHYNVGGDWVGFFIPFVELFRRFVWNIFRVENEHLNNCGEFRAVRDVPLPFNTSARAVEENDEAEHPVFTPSKYLLCGFCFLVEHIYDKYIAKRERLKEDENVADVELEEAVTAVNEKQHTDESARTSFDLSSVLSIKASP